MHIFSGCILCLYTVVSFTQTAKNFTRTYTDRLDTTEFKKKSTLHAIAFDVVWTLALVLNYTEEMRLNQSKEQAIHQNCSSNLTGDLVPLNKFNYSNAYMGCVMRHNFYKVNFTGVSVNLGHVLQYMLITTMNILP